MNTLRDTKVGVSPGESAEHPKRCQSSSLPRGEVLNTRKETKVGASLGELLNTLRDTKEGVSPGESAEHPKRYQSSSLPRGVVLNTLKDTKVGASPGEVLNTLRDTKVGVSNAFCPHYAGGIKNGGFTLETCQKVSVHAMLEKLKKVRFHSKNASNVVRPYYAGKKLKRQPHR